MKGKLMKLSNKKIISAWLKNMSGVPPGGWNSPILVKETQMMYLTRILRRLVGNYPELSFSAVVS